MYMLPSGVINDDDDNDEANDNIFNLWNPT